MKSAQGKVPLTDYQYGLLIAAVRDGRTSIYGPELRSAYGLVRKGLGTVRQIFRANYFYINDAGRSRAIA